MLLNSDQLGSHLANLAQHFLPADKVAELEKPENFEQDLDARAYLVLAHSAFEQFFEDTARDFSKLAVKRWKEEQPPTRQQITTLCCLAASQGEFTKLLALEGMPKSSEKKSLPFEKVAAEAGQEVQTIENKNDAANEPLQTPFTTGTNPQAKLLASLLDAEIKFDALLESNHGADLHYLHAIFTPIGIRIDPSPDAQTALNQIANARGTFAHRRIASKKGKFAYKSIASKQALSSVDILFSWCRELEGKLSDSLLTRDEIRWVKQPLLRRLIAAIETRIAQFADQAIAQKASAALTKKPALVKPKERAPRAR